MVKLKNKDAAVRKILIVDDNSELRENFVNLFEVLFPHTKIEQAENGKEAVERFHTFRPDLIMMDNEMPVLDGMSALTQILTYSPNTRVFLMSGNARDRDRAMQLGARKFFVKPFVVRDLVEEMVGGEGRL